MGMVRTNVTLPSEVIGEIDALAGPRGRSAYVAEAVRARLKRDRMRTVFEETLARRSGGPSGRTRTRPIGGSGRSVRTRLARIGSGVDAGELPVRHDRRHRLVARVSGHQGRRRSVLRGDRPALHLRRGHLRGSVWWHGRGARRHPPVPDGARVRRDWTRTEPRAPASCVARPVGPRAAAWVTPSSRLSRSAWAPRSSRGTRPTTLPMRFPSWGTARPEQGFSLRAGHRPRSRSRSGP